MDKYVAVFHQDQDSACGVHFPDLTGCFAAGETEEDALDNARISLRLYAEILMESGQALPRPRTIHELRADNNVRASTKEGGILVLFRCASRGNAHDA